MSEKPSGINVSESVIRKVRALLARTRENGCTEAEVESATIALERLLTQHNLSLADVPGDDSKSGIIEDPQSMGVGLNSSYRWLVCIGNGVAHLCYCRLLFVSRERTLFWVGDASDVAVAKELYAFLRDDALDRLRVLWAHRGRGANYRAFSSAFLLGYGERIEQRLFARAEERKSSKGEVAALVVTKEARISDFLANTELRRVSLRTRLMDADAYSTGQAHGEYAALRLEEKEATHA